MKLECGINLGGFLSQCSHKEEHYRNFIVEADIRQIARWGFDHVRLPVDYEVLEDEAGTVKASGYAYIDEVLLWCQKYNLGLVLDLHRAYGYDFTETGMEGKNGLFADEQLKQRFIRLWENIARHFAGQNNIAFELLNEVVEQENADGWNELIERTVTAIRGITKQNPIIYGGIQWNSVQTLKLLKKPKEENIYFTFHFYEPLLFTHQKAYWVKNMDPEKDVPYPESMDYYCRESEVLGYQGETVRKAKSGTMGTEFITEMIEEAVDAAKNAGVSLYCGEFGVIDRAPVEDTLRWFRDVAEVFRTYHISASVWSYKEMDFGLTERHYDSIRDDLILLWTKKQPDAGNLVTTRL